ncbi:MAG TPA: CarD family transcriptional regulator [Deinococcales bacterium]|nr:CarD family transcriptional regulator [Deinococcales bacterium]
MNFQVGERVVYPPEGGGTIREIVEREVLGSLQKYLKVDFVRGDMTLLVPLDSALQVGLRRTLDSDGFQRLREHAETLLDLPEQWPARHRTEQQILERCDAFELSRLIATLSVRDQERGLADTEREILETARALLASELAIVRGTDLGDAERWIDTELLGDGPAV